VPAFERAAVKDQLEAIGKWRAADGVATHGQQGH